MKKFYSAAVAGFFEDGTVGMPIDAVEISDEMHALLLAGQSQGKAIVADENGYPVLCDRPEPSGHEAIKMQIAALEAEITPRRLREAVLGTDNSWLQQQDALIAELRTQL